MIYTLTINPALDYIIEIQNFKLSNINRSEKEYIFPGGKGINVSIVLKRIRHRFNSVRIYWRFYRNRN